jgi:hypothetical protein
MIQFKIIPLSKSYAASIREKGVDDFGHQVVEQIATGQGPCRVSLKPGPIFIHSEEVEEYGDIHRFPPEIKADKKNFPLSLVGYNADQQMVLTELVGDRDVDELIKIIFVKHPEVSFLHARNAAACCYICRIERY